MGRSTPRAHSRAEHGLEALRNPSLTPPLLEAVEEAEGHEAHLVAGEGPGVPGMGGEAHNTLGYRWATAQGTPDTYCSRHLAASDPLACNLQKTLKPLRTRRSDTTSLFARCVLPGPFVAKRVAAVACCHCLLLMLRGSERGTSTHKNQTCQKHAKNPCQKLMQNEMPAFRVLGFRRLPK